MQAIRLIFDKINWWRWTSILLAGIFIKLIIDVAFSLIYRNYLVSYQWRDFLQIILFSLVVLEGLRFINRKLDHRMQWNENPVLRFFLQLAFNLAYVVVVFIIARYGITGIFQTQDFYLLSNELLIFSVIAVFTILVILVDLGQYLLQRWRYSLVELEQFKQASMASNFAMLKAQVNPHFLFNSLNTLSSLVQQDTAQARSFIRHLAKVYRYVLEQTDKELVPVKDELENLDAYIKLMSIRFRDNLMVVIEQKSEFNEAYLVPMTLQMLVENAIKHNVISSEKKLHIRVIVSSSEVKVINNLSPKITQEYSSGMGLKNIRKRYAYVSSRPVKIHQDQDHFEVSLPVIT